MKQINFDEKAIIFALHGHTYNRITHKTFNFLDLIKGCAETPYPDRTKGPVQDICTGPVHITNAQQKTQS